MGLRGEQGGERTGEAVRGEEDQEQEGLPGLGAAPRRASSVGVGSKLQSHIVGVLYKDPGNELISHVTT